MAISRKREPPFGISRTETRVTTRRYAVVKGGEGLIDAQRYKLRESTYVRGIREGKGGCGRREWCARAMCIREHV